MEAILINQAKQLWPTWSYCLFWECDNCVRMPPVLWVWCWWQLWCGDVVITGVKWQISRHTAGDITLVAVEDRLIRSFHLAAQHMSGLWGTKHYCWQSCIKRWCLILHILHTEAATIARKSLESFNWSLEMEHICMLDPSRCPLPITPRSVLPCLNGPPPPPPC